LAAFRAIDKKSNRIYRKSILRVGASQQLFELKEEIATNIKEKTLARGDGFKHLDF
jgi:hypothetical protein